MGHIALNFAVGTDRFESRYPEREIRNAPPEQLRELARTALEFIENASEQEQKPDMDHINNATVTLTRIVGQLSRDVERLIA